MSASAWADDSLCSVFETVDRKERSAVKDLSDLIIDIRWFTALS